MDTPKKDRKPGGTYVVLTVSMPADLRDALKEEWHMCRRPGRFSDFLRYRTPRKYAIRCYPLKTAETQVLMTGRRTGRRFARRQRVPLRFHLPERGRIGRSAEDQQKGKSVMENIIVSFFLFILICIYLLMRD